MSRETGKLYVDLYKLPVGTSLTLSLHEKHVKSVLIGEVLDDLCMDSVFEYKHKIIIDYKNLIYFTTIKILMRK